MKKVRIFSYSRETGGYEFSDYSCTAALEDGQAAEPGGDYRKTAGSVRIMTRSQIKARPGDYAAFNTERVEPDKNDDYLITAVRDNRRGGLPHWRLIINGRTRTKTYA